jgi:hypothetical protein
MSWVRNVKCAKGVRPDNRSGRKSLSETSKRVGYMNGVKHAESRFMQRTDDALTEEREGNEERAGLERKFAPTNAGGYGKMRDEFAFEESFRCQMNGRERGMGQPCCHPAAREGRSRGLEYGAFGERPKWFRTGKTGGPPVWAPACTPRGHAGAARNGVRALPGKEIDASGLISRGLERKRPFLAPFLTRNHLDFS